MNRLLEKDIKEFVESFELSNSLNDSHVLVTGATGLIGSTLIHCLFALCQNIKVIAPVRNIDKAREKVGKYDGLQLVKCNLETSDLTQFGNVDYIIHCAAPTSSKYFVDYPVETFSSIVKITDNILKYARQIECKSMVYLSSLEVYGQVLDDTKPVTEDMQGYLDPINVRSSYPMAKRAAENLCCLYAYEYGIPVKIARLTQTMGVGCDPLDNRVIAQFVRLAAKGKDIILRTTGESARPYCYTIDAVRAILYILLKGANGKAYNVANEETYISARDMAEYLKLMVNNKISVKYDIKDSNEYSPITKLRLSTEMLNNLGWTPMYDKESIFRKLINYFS